jgi:hypothetical protein
VRNNFKNNAGQELDVKDHFQHFH